MKEVNKKRDIYQAAVKFFGEKGYDNSSLDEIAKDAGVAKGTIFYHFNSKEELFSSLIDEGINILTEKMVEITKQKITIKQKLEKIIEIHFYFFKEHSSLCSMVLNQLGYFQNRWHKSAESIRKNYIPTLTLLIQEGKKEKIINRKLDTEAIIISLFSLLAVSGVDWTIFHSSVTQNKIIKTTKALIFKGIFNNLN